MIKFDLMSGYYYINIYEDYYQNFGFFWKINGKICYFVFIVLFFGLSFVGYIFIKILRLLVIYWRINLFLVIMYLDDGWVCDIKENCECILSIIQMDFVCVGFFVN